MSSPDSTLDPSLKRMAAAILVGGVAVVFDTTIVSIAIPTLTTALGTTLSTIQWVSTAYLLAMFAVLPVSGWAQARVGGRRLWLGALSVFTLGSILCGLAWSAETLIAARVVQGLGGGVMLPLMATLLMQAAQGKAPGKLMATIALPAAVGPILGPVLGGLILQGGHWPWLFWVNVPLGVLSFFLSLRFLPHTAPQPAARLDVVGLFLATTGIVGLIHGLSNVARAGGFLHAEVVVPALAGLALTTGFVFHALRKGPHALIDLRLFRHKGLSISTAVLFIAGMGLYGAMLLLPLYYRQVRGLDALATALWLIPQGVGTLISRGLAGRLVDRIGARPVVVTSFVVVTLAMLPFAFASAETDLWWLAAALFVRGMGTGGVVMPIMAAAYVGLSHDEIPHTSVVIRVGQQVGGSFGVALLAVMLQGNLAQASPGTVAAAFGATFWWVVALSAVGAAVATFLPGAEMTRVPLEASKQDKA